MIAICSGKLCKLGREYHRAGRFEDEVSALSKALDDHEFSGFKNRFARFNYGKALYLKGDYAGAMLVLGTVVEEPSSFRADALLFAARAAMRGKDWNKCEEYIGRVRQYYPKTDFEQEALYLSGLLELRRGKPLHAIDPLETSLQLAEAAGRRPEQKGQKRNWKQAPVLILLALIEAKLRTGDRAQAIRMSSRVLVLARRDALMELTLRYKLQNIFWSAAEAEQVIAFAVSIPQLVASIPAADREAAADIAPRAMTVAGNAHRALGDTAAALACYRLGRAMATFSSAQSRGMFSRSTETYAKSVVQPLKSQAELALSGQDEPLLMETLSEGEAVRTSNAEVNETYNVEVGKVLQAHRRGEKWIPLSEEVIHGNFARETNKVQEAKDLARKYRLDENSGASADYLEGAVNRAAFTNDHDEINTRLLLMEDLNRAGRQPQRQAQLAAVDRKVAGLDPVLRPWFSYRVGRSLHKIGDHTAARARYESVRSQYPGEPAARKALFMLAQLAEEQGDPIAAMDHYVSYLQQYPGDSRYGLQAALLAFDIAAAHPGTVPPELSSGLLDTLIADIPASDWRANLRAAQYLDRKSEHIRARLLLSQALSALESERAAQGVAPLSDEWIWPEQRVANALYQMGENDQLVDRFEAFPTSDYFSLAPTSGRCQDLFAICYMYGFALHSAGRAEDAQAYFAQLDVAFASIPDSDRAILDEQRIHQVWYGGSFRDAQPLIDEFLERYPTTFQAANFRVLMCLAYISDKDPPCQ